jgi:hypothetical protein
MRVPGGPRTARAGAKAARLGARAASPHRVGRMARLARRAVDVRHGRVQRALSAATAASALPLGLEIYFEHYRGSFGDKWMWTPVVLSPLLTAAGIAGVRSPRAATTWLPAVSTLYCLDGLIGVYTHVQGVRKRPGGFGEPLYNIVMGPPLLAPGSLAMVGGMGIAAALARRER